MSQPVERARRWVLSGRVQGVGFRWFVVRHGQRLGLTGRAVNLPDGRVEVVARGGPTALDELGVLLGEGPGLARVDNVEMTDIPHEHVQHKSFVIN